MTSPSLVSPPVIGYRWKHDPVVGLDSGDVSEVEPLRDVHPGGELDEPGWDEVEAIVAGHPPVGHQRREVGVHRRWPGPAARRLGVGAAAQRRVRRSQGGVDGAVQPDGEAVGGWGPVRQGEHQLQIGDGCRRLAELGWQLSEDQAPEVAGHAGRALDRPVEQVERMVEVVAGKGLEEPGQGGVQRLTGDLLGTLGEQGAPLVVLPGRQ